MLISVPDAMFDVFRLMRKRTSAGCPASSYKVETMHTLWTIVAGVLLLAVFLLFGQLWGVQAASPAFAAKAFVPVWLGISLVNLWVGVYRAGYGVREELPVLAIAFGVPALVAVTVALLLPRT